MNKSLLTILLLLVCYFGWTQQSPLYNQYYILPYTYNPSYAGFNPGANVSIIRNQKWTDFNSGYITNFVSASALLKDQKSGIGLDVYSDYVGITSKLKAHLSYSYKIQLADELFLRPGISVGVIDNRVNFDQAIVTNANDPLLTGAVTNRQTFLDVNFGLNLTYKDLYFGFAIPQTVGSKLYYSEGNGTYYSLERQYIGNLGYKWMINQDQKISLTPDALVIFSPGLPLNYNGSIMLDWEKYGWIAGTYKSNYAVGANVGINLVKNLKIGLAYDFAINSTSSYQSASNFEILLSYNIPQFSKKDTVVIEKERIIEKEVVVKETDEEKINELNQKIKALEDSLANQTTIKVKDTSTNQTTATTTQGAEIEDNEVTYNPNDHFIEIEDKSESPNGYYAVVGAFGNKENANKLLDVSKDQFPNSRIIFNERNQLYYVIIYYGTNLKEAKKVYGESRQLEEGRFYKTWLLDYRNSK